MKSRPSKPLLTAVIFAIVILPAAGVAAVTEIQFRDALLAVLLVDYCVRTSWLTCITWWMNEVPETSKD